MGQAMLPLAVVVEDDAYQREMLTVLLEESDMKVLQCESAEAAMLVLDKFGTELSLLITDIHLAGSMNGTDLAKQAKARLPHLAVVVTSGRERPAKLPPDAKFMPKPWRPLDVLREAARVQP